MFFLQLGTGSPTFHKVKKSKNAAIKVREVSAKVSKLRLKK